VVHNVSGEGIGGAVAKVQRSWMEPSAEPQIGLMRKHGLCFRERHDLDLESGEQG
jgi:hypothetical protein